MTFRKLRELLRYLIDIHRETAKLCEETAERAEERLAMLAQSIREKENPTFGRLEALAKDERIDALGSWVQFIPTDNLERVRAELRHAAEHEQEHFPEKTIQLHQEIVAMLKTVAEKIHSPLASGLVEELATFELQVLQQLQMTREMQYDL